MNRSIEKRVAALEEEVAKTQSSAQDREAFETFKALVMAQLCETCKENVAAGHRRPPVVKDCEGYWRDMTFGKDVTFGKPLHPGEFYQFSTIVTQVTRACRPCHDALVAHLRSVIEPDQTTTTPPAEVSLAEQK